MIAVTHWRSFSKIKTFGWSVALSKWLWARSRVCAHCASWRSQCEQLGLCGADPDPIRLHRCVCVCVCLHCIYLLLSKELCSYIYGTTLATHIRMYSFILYLFFLFKKKKGSIVQPHTRRYFFMFIYYSKRLNPESTHARWHADTNAHINTENFIQRYSI